MLRLLLIALSLLIVGCPTSSTGGDDDDSAGDDDDAANDDDATDRIEPAEGIWLLTLTEVGADDCNLLTGVSAGDSLGSTTLSLVKTADEDFTLTDSDDQTFHCTWGDDNTFVCDADVWTDSISALFPDALLVRNGSRSGTFDSATSATTTNINVNTCEGTECGLAEDAGGYQFPCTFGFDATMAR